MCGNNPCTCYTYTSNTLYFTCPRCGSTGGCNCYSPTITFSNTNIKSRYAVFKLPKEKTGKMPNKVYVSGRLVTVGILGSDVQAAYAKDKLVFSPGELNIVQFNERLTVSLDYGDWLYHYNVKKSMCDVVEFEDDSNIVKAELVSKVAQK
jgi:hypothetical protein